MPKLTYKPEGVEPQTWEFSFGRVTLGEMAAIQKLTKLSWDEVKQRFMSNDVVVIHALLYTFLKREKHALQPVDLEFFEDDYDLALTEAEIREQVESFSDGEARQALAAVSELPERTLKESDRLAIDLLRERVGEASETPAPKGAGKAKA